MGTTQEAHDSAHAELLLGVYAGDIRPDDPRIVRRAAECPACARDLRELGRLQQQLDRDAVEEASALVAERRSASETAPAGAAEVTAFLREHLAEQHRTRSARLRGPRWIGWALAASALLTLSLAWFWYDGRREEKDVALGGDAIEIVAPSGEVGSFAQFEWSSELDPGGWFELSIFALDAGPTDDPLVGPVRVRVTRYDLGTRVLPDAIRWEIQRFDSSEALVSSASASARRSSR